MKYSIPLLFLLILIAYIFTLPNKSITPIQPTLSHQSVITHKISGPKKQPSPTLEEQTVNNMHFIKGQTPTTQGFYPIQAKACSASYLE
tara:strand:- start:300 stop:566 length:267 start_codon:yes stop_codon:yes gene_type:complete